MQLQPPRFRRLPSKPDPAMGFCKCARRMFRRAHFVFWLALLPGILAGCSRPEPPADLTIINSVEPESLDPAIIVAQADMRVVQGLFEGLTRLEPVQARAVPGLAQNWEISSDGLTYTFHLRPNLKWSTGGGISSTDVVYSWIRALKPQTASRYAGQLYYLTNAEAFNAGSIKNPDLVGVHAVDPLTVRVQLHSPTAFFLDLCAFPTLAVVPRQWIEKYGDHWLTHQPLPVSGAYELAEWRLNDRIRLVKNPNYWDAAHTRSRVIDFLPVGSASTALNLYMSGQADVVWDKSMIPSQLLDLLLKRPDFHSFGYLGTYFIRFNTTRKPFDDPRVRQALALAVDKDWIVKKITRAGEKTTSHLVPDGTRDYTSPEGLGHDVARARQLLAEAGYPGGRGFPRFEYLFDGSAGAGGNIHESIALELQQMWREALGIQMDLRQVETQVFWGMQSRLDYTLARSSWIADYDDANTFLGMFVTGDGNNETGWGNPRYDSLVHEANQTVDPLKREHLFQQAETILIRDAVPIIPLYIYVGVNYFDTNKVRGIYENVLDDHPLQWIVKVKK